jgi:integrase
MASRLASELSWRCWIACSSCTSGGWTTDDPKTVKGMRDIAIGAELVDALAIARAEAGKPAKGWLFPSLLDPSRPDNPLRVAKLFRPAFDAAGLTGWTLRDLRHLHASLTLSQVLTFSW